MVYGFWRGSSAGEVRSGQVPETDRTGALDPRKTGSAPMQDAIRDMSAVDQVQQELSWVRQLVGGWIIGEIMCSEVK